MAVGIKCYRDGAFEAGQHPFFDSYGGYILGSAAFTNGVAGNVSNANLANGIPFWFVYAAVWQGGIPTFSVAGTTLSWTAGNSDGTVYYGIR